MTPSLMVTSVSKAAQIRVKATKRCRCMDGVLRRGQWGWQGCGLMEGAEKGTVRMAGV
jgi:hypothetical protein